MKKLSMLLVLCLLATALPVPDFALGETTGVEDAGWIEMLGDDAVLGELVDEAGFGEDGLLPEDAEAIEIVPDDPFNPGPDGGENAAQASANAIPEAAMAENPSGEDAQTEAGDGPHVDPDGPSLSAVELTLGKGEKFELEPSLPEGKSGKITFASDDPEVAKVSSKGQVTALAPGDACVTATAEDGTYAECYVHVKKAPDKVAFNVKSIEIGKGEVTGALKVVLGSVEGEYAGAYTFATSDSAVVDVDGEGVLTGVKAGTAKVTVKTYNGKKASCQVTVMKAPGKITASASRKKVGVGETGTLSYALPEGTACQATFTSSDTGVVEVDAQTGVYTGVGVGKTRVYARTYNGKKAYVTITVAPAPQTLAFDADTIRLGVGMTLTAAASLNEGAAGEITYSVKKESVASWSEGALTGVAKGKTVLTARTYNGLKAQCTVKVVAAPKSVSLPYKRLDIGLGASARLTPDVGSSVSTFTYASSNPKIASVSEDGTVTGVKKGVVNVTVSTYNDKRFKLKVYVMKAADSVSVSPSALELAIGESERLTCAFPKNTSASVTFASSDPSVAEVDEDTGVVSAVGPGEAVITATTHSGVTDRATVVVYPAPEWIDVMGIGALGVGQSCPLQIALSEGSRSPLRFESADAAVATVSEDGVVYAVGEGKTVVTVRTNAPEVYAAVNVTVKPAPDTVKFKKSSMKLDVHDTAQLKPVIDKGTAAGFSYQSSNEAVATVSEDGVVLAVAKGKTTLTAITHNGLKASLKLTVSDPWFPEEIKLVDAPEYIMAGESVQLQWIAKPAGAEADLTFSSADPSIAAVDDSGLLTGVSYGYVKITATSRRNTALSLQFTVGVETDDVTLEIPARITSVDGIEENLAKIDAIRASAIRQIEGLQERGAISKSDASKREKIINNAFKDYAFPWMTLKKQKYWKAKNSEGGAKDFKTKRVYYGIPYTQNKRGYNVARELKEKRYYSSGKGYYILNQKNLRSGTYCGNDCSTFVDAAIWGTNSSHSYDRTGDIQKSSAYKTVKSYSKLRTGDLICLGGHHVVMFLYYINAEKTKMMIIENGGIEKGTNTVHCMVMNTSWYTSRGYKVRRLKSLG